MKAKNQQHYTSEVDAKEKLIVYVYEYLVHSNARAAADLFKDSIGYAKQISVTNESPGFLSDWWSVFWDLYCAAPERRHNQPESTGEARAFHDYMRSGPMSPSITQASPPQHPHQPPPQFMGDPRYVLPPGQVRGMPPRMPGPPHHGPPHPGGPPAFMPSGSPRYPHHPGPPPQPHMNQGPPMFAPGPDQMGPGPSPGLNRMTPVTPQQVVGPPPNPPQPQMVAMPNQQIGPGQGPPQVNSMPGGGPPRNGSHGGGWQGNVNYNVNSPANQQCYSGPGSNQPNQSGPMMMNDGMMDVKNSPANIGDASTPHPDEYVMPPQFGQDSSGQNEAEILKLKQSMQEDTTKMYEKQSEQSELNYDYSDSQNKWP